MQTIVKFYRLSGKTPDNLILIAEDAINESLAHNLPEDALVRSVQTAFYMLDNQYHLIVTVMIDVPDSVPKERLGFRLGGPPQPPLLTD